MASKANSQMSFNATVDAAVADMARHGFDDLNRVAKWTQLIRDAALRSITPPYVVEDKLSKIFGATYHKLIDNARILVHHPTITRFGVERIRQASRRELERRKVAAASLIKLNKARMVEETMQRWEGWVSSVPAGGSKAIDKSEVKAKIKQPLRSSSFIERRVYVDQGHKFLAAVNEIIADDNGAIGGYWHSHFRQAGYNYREDHKERDGLFYVQRGNWAQKAGYLDLSKCLFADEYTNVGEEIFCRCNKIYAYSLADIPYEILSDKGRKALAEAKQKIAMLR